jgi:hypothetical protein
MHSTRPSGSPPRALGTRIGQIACELDDLVLQIANGPLDDDLLCLAPWAAYLATSVCALDALLDEVEFGSAHALRAAA